MASKLEQDLRQLEKAVENLKDKVTSVDMTALSAKAGLEQLSSMVADLTIKADRAEAENFRQDAAFSQLQIEFEKFRNEMSSKVDKLLEQQEAFDKTLKEEVMPEVTQLQAMDDALGNTGDSSNQFLGNDSNNSFSALEGII